MRRRDSSRGFTYIGVLALVAILGIAQASIAVLWNAASQREKERQLLSIGQEFRRAIARYHQGSPGAVKAYPRTLEDLLLDKRFPGTRRYLRRIYVDPMTGSNQWGLVAAPDGGVMGVYSLSEEAPYKTEGFRFVDRSFSAAKTYAEWKFTYGADRTPSAPRQPTRP